MADILSVLPPSVSTIHPHPTSLAGSQQSKQQQPCKGAVAVVKYGRYYTVGISVYWSLCAVYLQNKTDENISSRFFRLSTITRKLRLVRMRAEYRQTRGSTIAEGQRISDRLYWSLSR